MKLLIEQIPIDDFDCLINEEVLDESNSQVRTKQYFITGPFLQSEIKNHNQRIYRKPVMVKEVNRYITTKLNNNQAMGELGHPDTPTINLDRVSHKIVALTESGNNWIGKAKVLDTPFGKIVKNLMDEKVRFGVSSRGLGSLKEINGAREVQSDYFLITPADIVSDPSGPDCFVSSLYEHKEWVFENEKLVMIEKDIRKEIDAAHAKVSKVNESELLHIFTQILLRI